MHKIVAFILAVLYLGTTSGMVVNIHYCMGKIASVKLDNFNAEDCNKCGAKTKGSCCRDEIKVVKLTEVHKQVNNASGLQIPVLILAPTATTIYISYANVTILNGRNLANAPPLLSTDLYIKNCVFRV